VVISRAARRAQHRLGQRLELARPPLGLVGDRADVVVADAEVAADLHMMGILVRRPREIADLQDGHLAQARIEPAPVANEVAEPVEGARAVRAVRQQAMEIDVALQEILVLGRKVRAVEVR
jgi:hypothetical protein